MYTPVKPIKHTIIITWGEVNVPNSPFRVRIKTPMHTQANAALLQLQLVYYSKHSRV